MSQPIRWGVLGPGNIAREFAGGMTSLDDNVIAAVGSRSLDRARQFAGGALLDVGVYTIAFAFMVLGYRPKSVLGAAHIGETGVDEQTGIVIEYENGALACLSCAVRTATPQTGRIDGADGRIVIPRFWRAESVMLESGAGAPQTFEHPHDRDGFSFEVMEAARCIRDGKTESDVMPLEETVAIAETMDDIRRQIGLVYPMETV